MEWPCIIQIPGRYRRHSPPGWGPASAPRRVRSPRQANHAPDRRAGEPTPNLRMDVKHAHGLSQALANNCLRQVGLRCGRGDQGAASAAPRLPHLSRSQGDHTAARTEPPAKGWIDPDAGVGQDHHVTPDGHRPLLCRQEPRTEESGHQAVPTAPQTQPDQLVNHLPGDPCDATSKPKPRCGVRPGLQAIKNDPGHVRLNPQQEANSHTCLIARSYLK